MSTAEDPDRLAERKAGCASFSVRFLKLLVPLFMVAIAISLLLPNSNLGDLAKSRIRLIEQHTMASLARGLLDFQAEYAPPRTREDLTTITDATFIRPLLALDDTLNPRRIKFVDLPDVKRNHPGLIGYPPVLVDEWGQPYHITLDTNNDGQVANPEFAADPAWKLKVHTTETLKRHTAIYSSGPDRDPKTWQDNITNWR